MVILATPISHLFEDDNVAREILEASDCLECRDRTVDIRMPKEELFHFDANLIHFHIRKVS